MQRRFRKHIAMLRSRAQRTTEASPEPIAVIESEIVKAIEQGKLRKALFTLLDYCPRKFNNCDANTAYWLMNLYEIYIGKIFTPELMSKE